MAEYEGREAKYNNGVGKLVAGIIMGCVLGDNEAKDAYVSRQIELMSQEEPNAEFMARTTLVGLDEALETRVSVPKIILAPSKPFIVERANIALDMSVSARSDDSFSMKSDTELEGEGGVKAGIISASMRIKAAVSVAKEQKRSSDYTSTTHVDVTMCQGEAPEGLMKIIDSLNLTATKALELNADIIENQYGTLARSAQNDGEAVELAEAA